MKGLEYKLVNSPDKGFTFPKRDGIASGLVSGVSLLVFCDEELEPEDVPLSGVDAVGRARLPPAIMDELVSLPVLAVLLDDEYPWPSQLGEL